MRVEQLLPQVGEVDGDHGLLLVHSEVGEGHDGPQPDDQVLPQGVCTGVATPIGADHVGGCVQLLGWVVVAPALPAGPLHSLGRDDGGHGVEEGVSTVLVARDVLPSHPGELVPATGQRVVLALVHQTLHGVVGLLEKAER